MDENFLKKKTLKKLIFHENYYRHTPNINQCLPNFFRWRHTFESKNFRDTPKNILVVNSCKNCSKIEFHDLFLEQVWKNWSFLPFLTPVCRDTLFGIHWHTRMSILMHLLINLDFRMTGVYNFILSQSLKFYEFAWKL